MTSREQKYSRMKTVTPKIRFDKSGYYFIGLLLLAFFGFWNSYFSRLFIEHNNSSIYFHFHVSMMLLWVTMLIAQPLLIRKKLLRLHRLIGKTSYFVMPLMLISVLLVLNSAMKNISINAITFNMFLPSIRDFILLTAAFSIGIYYRNNIQIHSRAMIITGIIFIEPALFRFLNGILFKNMDPWGTYIGIALILTLIIGLIIIECKQKSGRWLFPSLLTIYIFVYSVMVFQIPLSLLDPFARWFAGIPIT